MIISQYYNFFAGKFLTVLVEAESAKQLIFFKKEIEILWFFMCFDVNLQSSLYFCVIFKNTGKICEISVCLLQKAESSDLERGSESWMLVQRRLPAVIGWLAGWPRSVCLL